MTVQNTDNIFSFECMDPTIEHDQQIQQIHVQIETNRQQIQTYRSLINQLEHQTRQLEHRIHQMEAETRFNNQLNDHQKAVVHGKKGNSIIIACPGSGKTHTLVAKVAFLINQEHVDPKSILLVTFTKKAAQEMLTRLKQQTKNYQLLHIGTLHGFAYRSLQRYRQINFTILDEIDQRKALREQIKRLVESVDTLTTDEKTTLIKVSSKLYDQVCSQYPVKLKTLMKKAQLGRYYDYIHQGFTNYANFKSVHNYLDFPDLMFQFLRLLKSPAAAELLDQIRYIFFDEYQDINGIQNEILKLLNSRSNNLTVVEDDAQAIYGFRGSRVKYILQFEKEYNHPIRYQLDINYRSPPEIINLCNGIIRHNHRQITKTMVPHKPLSYQKPMIKGFRTDNEEVVTVVAEINRLRGEEISLSEMAIICRKNRQLDRFELELIKKQVPYVKSRGIGILDRVHIKDFLAFLVVFDNKNSIIHWKRILMMQKGVGEQTSRRILNQPETVFDRLVNKTTSISQLAPLSDLIIRLDRIMGSESDDKSNRFCSEIIRFLTPTIHQNTREKEQMTADDKIADLHLLQEHVADAKSLSEFLADIHLTTEITRTNKQVGAYLLLSTVHGAKGLEWEYVFFCGVSSDHFPSYQSSAYMEQIDEVEEERRLFYVGCSRAKRRLWITYSDESHYKENVYSSPFIGELDQELYESTNLTVPPRITTGNVTTIVSNFISINTVSAVYPLLKTLRSDYNSYYANDPNPSLYQQKWQLLYGSFIDNLITKMVYQKYKAQLPKLTVPIYEKFNLPKDRSYHTYIDPNNDWRDCLAACLAITERGSRSAGQRRRRFTPLKI